MNVVTLNDRETLEANLAKLTYDLHQLAQRPAAPANLNAVATLAEKIAGLARHET